MSTTLFNLQHDHIQHLLDAYQATLGAHGVPAVAIYSGHASPHFGDDQTASFQSYGHFIHWVGMAHVAHSWVVIEPGQRPKLLLHAPSDFWHLPTTLPDEPWVDAFDIELCQTLTAPPLPAGGVIIGDRERLEAETPLTLTAPSASDDLLRALDELRMVKTPYEIACLREANRLATAGHEAAQAAFLGAANELDIQLAYLAASRQRESQVPYQNIIGINGHAGVLHYQHYDLQAPKQRYSLLVDAGRRFRGYSADITRTHSGPDAPRRFGELISAVTALKNSLIEHIAPGVDYVALHHKMHQQLASILIEHSLYKGSTDEAISNGVTRAFCPHGLGHSLGIQVHDVAGLRHADGTPAPAPEHHPALRLTRVLRPGMVVTIEPGLYFIPMLLAPLKEQGCALNWPLIEALTPCGGIRIEDNVVVTESGYDNLTN